MSWYIAVGIAISFVSFLIGIVIKLSYSEGEKETLIDSQKDIMDAEKDYLDDAVKPARNADELLDELRKDGSTEQL